MHIVSVVACCVCDAIACGVYFVCCLLWVVWLSCIVFCTFRIACCVCLGCVRRRLWWVFAVVLCVLYDGVLCVMCCVLCVVCCVLCVVCCVLCDARHVLCVAC